MMNPNSKEMHLFLQVQEHDKEKPEEATTIAYIITLLYQKSDVQS